MEKLKYVRLERYNEVIIFPQVIQHDTFKHLKPVSAGFCIISLATDSVDCWGESVSLGLSSNKIEDSYYATKQVFGIDEADKILK